MNYLYFINKKVKIVFLIILILTVCSYAKEYDYMISGFKNIGIGIDMNTLIKYRPNVYPMDKFREIDYYTTFLIEENANGYFDTILYRFSNVIEKKLIDGEIFYRFNDAPKKLIRIQFGKSIKSEEMFEKVALEILKEILNNIKGTPQFLVRILEGSKKGEIKRFPVFLWKQNEIIIYLIFYPLNSLDYRGNKNKGSIELVYTDGTDSIYKETIFPANSEEVIKFRQMYEKYLEKIDKYKGLNFDTREEKIQKDYPKVEIAEKEYNFGNVKEGEKVIFKIKLANKGKVSLEIKDIKTSCGCTTRVKEEKNIIEPFKEEIIEMEFDSKGKEGKQEHTITIYTNDPENPKIDFMLTGTVKK